MKAIVWKELRENFRWAVLGCLVLTLAEFYVFSSERHDLQNGYRGNITITSPTFLMVVLFGSAMVAACLGVLQVLPESNRDRWAALLHRPVPRGVIFGGKAVAGLGLYAVAVTLPFLASACYAAWPGKFPAPFVTAMLLPGLHDIAGGAAFYAAASLLCLHRGRWFGTRGVMLLAAGAVLLLQLASEGPFLLLPVAATSMLLLAAWGVMLGNGTATGRSWPGWAAFLAVAWLGAQSGLLLLDLGLNSLPGAESTQVFRYTQVEVTLDGQFLKRTSNSKGEDNVVTDLAGRPITDERYVGNDSYQYLCQFWPLSFQLKSLRRGFLYTDGTALRGGSYVQTIVLGNFAKEIWYFLAGRNYFIGYDSLSCRCVGICDREGFKAPGARPAPFDGPVAGEHLMQARPTWFWTRARLYRIDFLDRRTIPFFDLPGDAIDAVMQVPDRGSYESYRYVVAGLENEFRVFDAQGKTLFARPYLHDPRVWTSVEVAANTAGDRLYVQSQNGIYFSGTEHFPTIEYLDELDLQGNVLHSYASPIEAATVIQPLWRTAALTASLPLVPALLDRLYRKVPPASPMHETFAFNREILMIEPMGWMLLGVFACVLSVVVFVWARRVGFATRTALGWAAFVFALGPAGLLTFRLASAWPERVRCPSCGHLRSISRERCAHCQKAWSTPPPTGTEIVQPLAI